MNKTVYRPVPGFTDLYAGTDGSIVKSGHGVLEPKLYANARYYKVYTRCGRRGGTQFVHALVAAAFLGEPAEGMVVRHGSDGEFDNSIGNLCYGSAKDNIGDSIDRGVHRSVRNSAKTVCAQGHPLTPDNIYTRPGTAHRACRTCRKAWSKKHNSREVRQARRSLALSAQRSA